MKRSRLRRTSKIQEGDLVNLDAMLDVVEDKSPSEIKSVARIRKVLQANLESGG